MKLVYTLLFLATACVCGPKPYKKKHVSSGECRAWQYDDYGAKCVDPK
jgi:hypothetical protein